MRDLFILPHTAESVPTPREKLIFPTGRIKITKLHKFEEVKQKMEKLGYLDRQDFNDAKEIGIFLDFYNESKKKAKEERAHDDITEISKLVANMMSQKHILLHNPKKAIIDKKEKKHGKKRSNSINNS